MKTDSMTKEERGRMLRARFRALGGIPYPQITRKPRLNTAPLTPKQGARSAGPFFGVSLCERRSQWVSVPDAEQVNPLGRRRRAKVKTLLTRLASKAPMKLILNKETLTHYPLIHKKRLFR